MSNVNSFGVKIIREYKKFDDKLDLFVIPLYTLFEKLGLPPNELYNYFKYNLGGNSNTHSKDFDFLKIILNVPSDNKFYEQFDLSNFQTNFKLFSQYIISMMDGINLCISGFDDIKKDLFFNNGNIYEVDLNLEDFSDTMLYYDIIFKETNQSSDDIKPITCVYLSVYCRYSDLKQFHRYNRSDSIGDIPTDVNLKSLLLTVEALDLIRNRFSLSWAYSCRAHDDFCIVKKTLIRNILKLYDLTKYANNRITTRSQTTYTNLIESKHTEAVFKAFDYRLAKAHELINCDMNSYPSKLVDRKLINDKDIVHYFSGVDVRSENVKVLKFLHEQLDRFSSSSGSAHWGINGSFSDNDARMQLSCIVYEIINSPKLGFNIMFRTCNHKYYSHGYFYNNYTNAMNDNQRVHYGIDLVKYYKIISNTIQYLVNPESIYDNVDNDKYDNDESIDESIDVGLRGRVERKSARK